MTARKGLPQPPSRAAGLRLRGEDAEDLAVISACLQDALVAVRDLAYDRDAHLFTMVANRFRWESDGGDGRFERTLCALAFDTVEEVVYRGFRRSEEDRILSLLVIQSLPATSADGAASATRGTAAPRTTASGAVIELEFADGAAIRLAAGGIRCRARDVGEPWPTVWQPRHPLDLAG
ncbi:MAG: DUF2948 family protein [Thiohalocapsa sp.]